MIKTFHKDMATFNLTCMDTLCTLYYEFFIRKDYDWWYTVKPGDIVVDIGANIGMFTCSALDKGAKKVYAIEPNLNLLKTTMYNAAPHIVNGREVIPINCAIASDISMVTSVHGNKDTNPVVLKTFKDIIKEYKIDRIDYLKIDCEGGEYFILNEENLEFIKNNVKHIAVEVHLDFHDKAPELYMQLRDKFLVHFKDKLQFIYPDNAKLTFETDWLKPNNYPKGWMIYICNHNI
jgi:FkbM family methyltransferase